MLLAAITTTDLASLDPTWWWAGLGILLLAAGLGFIGGFTAARWSDHRSYRRARAGLDHLFQTVLQTLDAARDVCTLLERHPGQFLKPEQTAALEGKRTGLLESLTRILTRHTFLSQAEQREQREPASVKPVVASPARCPKIELVQSPLDPVTGLPDKTALEANLESLLELANRSHHESSLLLVRVDKHATLRTRHGGPGTDKLLKKLAGVICRAVRAEDIVCRYGADAIAVLLPGVTGDAGEKLARAVRDSVRSHHFRIEEDGPEILLTASFGYTPCRSDDNRDLILNRAADALSKSQRVGRNQLHVHDGNLLVHCAAS